MVRDGMHSVRVGDGLKSFAVRRFAPGVLRTCSDGKCENVYGSNLKSPRNSTDNRNDYEQVSYWVKPPSRASSVRGTAFFCRALKYPPGGPSVCVASGACACLAKNRPADGNVGDFPPCKSTLFSLR